MYRVSKLIGVHSVTRYGLLNHRHRFVASRLVHCYTLAGNDGTVKSNDLKKAFEEKGATVVDCFVPEGKHFGFISFSSQEDAEKYGSMMNGR